MGKVKSIAEQYAYEMKNHFGGGYYVAWEPGIPLQLGDIGELNNGIFYRKDNIGNVPFNLIFDIREDKDVDKVSSYVSQGSVNWQSKSSGQVAPMGSVLKDLDSGIVIEFGKDKSTVFEAMNIRHHSIENQITLEKAILDLYQQGVWQKHWVIITELYKADSATILISQTANAKIEIKASASTGVGNISIADFSLGLSRQSSQGLGYQILAEKGLTPKFKLMGTKRRLLKKPVMRQMLMKEQTDETVEFQSVTDCTCWTGE
jgi:hypothetical protein